MAEVKVEADIGLAKSSFMEELFSFFVVQISIYSVLIHRLPCTCRDWGSELEERWPLSLQRMDRNL